MFDSALPVFASDNDSKPSILSFRYYDSFCCQCMHKEKKICRENKKLIIEYSIFEN